MVHMMPTQDLHIKLFNKYEPRTNGVRECHTSSKGINSGIFVHVKVQN